MPEKNEVGRTTRGRAAFMAGCGWTGDHISYGYYRELPRHVQHLAQWFIEAQPLNIEVWGIVTYEGGTLQLRDRNQPLYFWPLGNRLRREMYWGPEGQNRDFHVSFGW